MINNKKMYYWIGGIAVIIVAALAIIFSQGQLFSGNLTGFSAFRPAATTTPACISYIYSDWGPCSANGTQTRTVTGSNPINCVGGALPILSQACESKGIITLESPEQNALLNYAISNQVFSWKNKGFGQSSSGGYTIDLGCDNNNYPIHEFGGQVLPLPWDDFYYLQDNKDKDILTKKLDKTKNMYCYWRVKYFSDHNVTGSPTAESDVGHFIFTPPPKGIITLESPEQNALLNYAISNQVFSWKNKGFGQSSSGGYTIDLGCDNNNYRINSFDGHEFPVSWEELSYIQDNKDKDILTKKLDKTKNMYCYWRVKYFSDHNVTGSPTAESDVGHFIFTPQTRK